MRFMHLLTIFMFLSGAGLVNANTFLAKLLELCRPKQKVDAPVDLANKVDLVETATVKKRTPVETALSKFESQDEQNYFFKALLRNDEHRKKINEFAEALYKDFKLKNPKASQDEESIFLDDLNKLLSWKMSEDLHFNKYVDEWERFQEKMWNISFEDFTNRVEKLFDEMGSERTKSSNVQIVSDFIKNGVELGLIRAIKSNEIGYVENLNRQLDALRLLDPSVYAIVFSKMKQTLKNLPHMTERERKIALHEIDVFFNSRSYLQGHDWVPQAAANYMKSKTNDYLWIQEFAHGVSPLPQDNKSYFMYIAKRIKDAENRGFIDKEGLFDRHINDPHRNLGRLLVLLDGESVDHLSRTPWNRKRAESFADHLSFRRLRKINPTLANESPNIIIPKSIISFILENYMTKSQEASSSFIPRSREFDDEFFQKLDTMLNQYFNRK